MQFSPLLFAALAGLSVAAPYGGEWDDCVPDYDFEPEAPSAVSSETQPIATSVFSSSVIEATPTPTSTPVVEVPVASSSSVEVVPTTSVAAVEAAAVTTAAASTDYESIVLTQHNVHRANHSAADLTYDTALASSAASVAATCVFEHVVNGDYGQNLAAATLDSATQAVGEAITEGWYNGEVNLFDGLYGQANPSMSNFEGWGHFTQVVWKSTTTVGCATQKCAAGTIFSMESYFTVCNYASAGNYAGEYADNVGEPLGQATVTF